MGRGAKVQSSRCLPLPCLFLVIPLTRRQHSCFTTSTFLPGMFVITELLTLFPLAPASWPYLPCLLMPGSLFTSLSLPSGWPQSPRHFGQEHPPSPSTLGPRPEKEALSSQKKTMKGSRVEMRNNFIFSKIRLLISCSCVQKRT